VHLVHNEGESELDTRLMIISDQPRLVETWDTVTGAASRVACHEKVAEPTYVPVSLCPGESLLLTTRPLAEAGAIEPATSAREDDIKVVRRWFGSARPAIVSTTTGAESLELLRQFTITLDGELETLETGLPTPDLPANFELAPWEQRGLGEFSGTARYRLGIYVPNRYLNRRLLLDLGKVGFVAEAWLNGQYLGLRAWAPYEFDITGMARADANDLTVEVTNTLANQAVREEVVQMARERGWFNAYYERALPWLGESLRSGLIGPVRVRATR